jgi:hypothetical protein
MKLNFHEHFSPSHDVVFGIMFSDRDLFCRLVFAATGDKIEIENDPLTQATLQEKDVLLNKIRFDILSHEQNKKIYSLDMQRTYTKAQQERRIVFYACRALSTQNVKDMAYDKLDPVHVSFILTSHRDKRAVRHIKLCDIDTHEIFDDLLSLTQIYVPTVLKTYNKENDLYIFAKFFKIANQKAADYFAKEFETHELGKELIVMYNDAVANIQQLEKIEDLPYFTRRLTDAQLEEAKQKAMLKGLQDGIQKGLQKGIKKGIKEGRQDGIKEGRQDGERKKAMEVAQNMLSLNFSPDIISQCLNLDIDTIRSLKP